MSFSKMRYKWSSTNAMIIILEMKNGKHLKLNDIEGMKNSEL